MATPRQNELLWDYSDTEQIPANFQQNLETTPLLTENFLGRLYSSNEESGLINLTQQGLENILRNLDNSAALLRRYLAAGPGDTASINTQISQGIPHEKSGICHRCLCKSLWDRFSLSTHFSRNLLIITVILQATSVSITSVFDAVLESSHHVSSYITASETLMVFIQTVNLFVVIITTGLLVMQIAGRDISSSLLARSYLATALLFAGIYSTAYRLNVKGWHDISHSSSTEPDLIIEVYIRMFYLSISTATLSGGCPVHPTAWYNQLLIALQMLLSFGYFVQILAVVMATNRHHLVPALEGITRARRLSQGSNTVVLDDSRSEMSDPYATI